jgi:hypothetical protein
MNDLNKNRLVTLLAVIAMMVIAGSFGYRLQVNAGGFTFERNVSKN